MIKSEIIKLFSQNFSHTPSTLFYTQDTYLSNNDQLFADIMGHLLKNTYCENKSGNIYCGTCRQCLLIKNLSHPDVKIVAPSAGGIRNFLLKENPEKQWAINKEDVVEAQDFIQNSQASLGRMKTVVFWLPEFMNVVAMNVLLKTVEEPPHDAQFLFFTKNRDALLPTLLSRTMQFFVASEEDFEMHEDENMDLFVEWMRLCYAKKYDRIVGFIEDIAKRGKEFQKNFLQFLGFIFEQLWLSSLKLYTLVKLVDKNLETINKMAKIYSPETIAKMYTTANAHFKNLTRNANVKLLLMDLSLKISNQ